MKINPHYTGLLSIPGIGKTLAFNEVKNMELAPQSIPDKSLIAITDQFRSLFKFLSINKESLELKFGKEDNYIELDKPWFNQCYDHHTRDGYVPFNPINDMALETHHDIMGFCALKENTGGPQQSAIYLLCDIEENKRLLTFIHESVHLNSIHSKGFRNWTEDGNTASALPEYLNSDGLAVLDEGATELFARIIRYELNSSAGEIFGNYPLYLTTHGLPAYAYSLAIACDIANIVGLAVFARAYFLGEMVQFREILEATIKKSWKKNDAFPEAAVWLNHYFGLISNLSVGSYQKWTISDLKKDFGIYFPDNEEALRAAVKSNSYNCPALQIWGKYRPAAPDSQLGTPLLALGAIGAIYVAYQLVGDDQ